MKCHGKCYLKKKIKKVLGDEKENTSQKSVEIKESLFYSELNQTLFPYNLNNIGIGKLKFPLQIRINSFNFHPSLLRPPITFS